MWLFIVYFSVLLVLVLLFFLLNTDNDDSEETFEFSFPAMLDGMGLTYEESGEGAKSQIDRMHIGEFEIVEGYMGEYEGESGKSAFFWIAVTNNQSDALELTEKMTDAIENQNTPFSDPELINVNNTSVESVYYTYGTGQEHYYWYDDNLMIWMALTNFQGQEFEFVKISIDEL
jgi:hypothetical protein